MIIENLTEGEMCVAQERGVSCWNEVLEQGKGMESGNREELASVKSPLSCSTAGLSPLPFCWPAERRT